jgi:hypothetical protein
VLLTVKNMGGETTQAWRAVLDDRVKRELRKPELLIVDGGTGLEQALAALWAMCRPNAATVHKHRNLRSPMRPSMTRSRPTRAGRPIRAKSHGKPGLKRPFSRRFGSDRAFSARSGRGDAGAGGWPDLTRTLLIRLTCWPKIHRGPAFIADPSRPRVISDIAVRAVEPYIEVKRNRHAHHCAAICRALRPGP